MGTEKKALEGGVGGCHQWGNGEKEVLSLSEEMGEEILSPYFLAHYLLFFR